MTTKEYQRTNPQVLTNNCPFECVRSSELHKVIHHYFGKTIIRDAAYGHLQHMRYGLTDNTSDKYFDILELMDRFVAEHHLLQANRLFGVYRKSEAALMKSSPWNKAELQQHI